jgi:hypothetical protein
MAAFQDVMEFVRGVAGMETAEEAVAARGAAPATEDAEAALDRLIGRARALFPQAKREGA